MIPREEFDRLIGRWIDEREVLAPVAAWNDTHFRPIANASEIIWDYVDTVVPPSKTMHEPQQDLVQFTTTSDGHRTEPAAEPARKSVLLGVHPCDLHGIMVLERTLMGTFTDPYYAARRRNTVIVGLNCQRAGKFCFCASYGTGPFFRPWMGQGPPGGCDLLLTAFDGSFLAEPMTSEGAALINGADGAAPPAGITARLEQAERRAIGTFTKGLDIRELPELLMKNLDHPIWERVGEGRCLSCTNCTMACPTCYCYRMRDRLDFDLGAMVRYRQWDSCQDYSFAKVHFGNFRSTRAARLRQFVCHKLSYWVKQHGCFGCIGCGRCIRLCPTGIDLAEMATEIRMGERRQ